jgi:hypothetical protein
MIDTLNLVAAALLAAAPTSPGPGKLAPAVAKEMTEAIVAVNKALGLESWPAHGAVPCLDRGGQGITAKEVTAEDTRKCAGAALEKGFPELGKSYVVAIKMAPIGPATVIAVGTGDASGWGAYSCDPQRKCNPVKLGQPAKWSKRTTERQTKACEAQDTVWFPADGAKHGCAGNVTTVPAGAAPVKQPAAPDAK